MKKQPSHKKSRKLFWVIGSGAAALVLIMVLTVVFIKWRTSSQAAGLAINSPQSAQVTGSQSDSANGETLTDRVTMTPIDKTKDQAQSDGSLQDNSSASDSGSSQNNNGYGNNADSSSQSNYTNAANPADGSSQPAANSGTISAGQPGEGLDASTVNQLRSFGIRQGDLEKINQMVADGFDPKEIAKSLRDNGNKNLAAVMDNVPRRPKKSEKKDGGPNKNQDIPNQTGTQYSTANGQDNNGYQNNQ